MKKSVVTGVVATIVIVIVALALGFGLGFGLKSSKGDSSKTTTPSTVPSLPAIFLFGGYDERLSIFSKSIIKYCPMAICSGGGKLQKSLFESSYFGTAGVLGDHVILKFDDFTNKVQLYNYKSGEVKYGPSTPNQLIMQAGATQFGKGLYVIGGAHVNGSVKDVWKYDDSGKWSQVASLIQGSKLSAAATWRSQIVLCGGSTDTDVQATERCEIYDANTDKWSIFPSMKEKRFKFSLVNIDDKLFAIGGLGEMGLTTNSVEYYDGNSWKMTEGLGDITPCCSSACIV